MRIIVVGATSEIAQRCCQIWLKGGSLDLVLTGRNKKKLTSIAADLRIRFPKSKIDFEVLDHLSPRSIEEFVEKVSQSRIDIALVAHGSLTSQSRASADPKYLWQEHETNAQSPILFAELFATALTRQGHGRLAIIGSVAGDRGRAINHAYGSAKAGLATYISGLQHRLAGSAVRVSLIKPGPTRTPMTVNVHVGPSKLADAGKVAKQIVKGISRGRRVIYSPSVWRQIMFLVRILPFWLFKQLRF
jgi:short-subunit dehydrogenase